jgi:hypothetical protein
MIKLKIKDQTFELASEWKEVFFGQFIRIKNINEDVNYPDYEKSVRIIAAISDNPDKCLAALRKLPYTEFNEIAREFEWTNVPITKHNKSKSIINIDGKKYRLKKDCNQLLVEDMVSINLLLVNNIDLDPLEVAFGVLLREIKNNKEVELSFDEFTNVLSNLSDKVKLLDVYQHLLFFSSGKTTFSQNGTKGYSIQKI